jgi:hypothetical protein
MKYGSMQKPSTKGTKSTKLIRDHVTINHLNRCLVSFVLFVVAFLHFSVSLCLGGSIVGGGLASDLALLFRSKVLQSPSQG